MAMDANLQADFALIKGIMDWLYEVAAKDSDARAKLAKKLLEYYNANGSDKLSLRLINSKYANEVEQALQRENIPYMMMTDTAGNVQFMLPDERDYDYDSIINQIYARSPEFYKTLTNQNFAQMVLNDGNTEMVELRFEDEKEAINFRNRAFGKGTGMVSTDKMNPDGTCSVFVRKEDFFKLNGSKDCIDTILDKTISDKLANHDLRDMALKFDEQQINHMMHKINVSKEPFVICDVVHPDNAYISFDGNNLYRNYLDNETNQWIQKEIYKIDKTTLKSFVEQDAIRRSLEYNLSTIHNSVILNNTEFSLNRNKNTQEITREMYENRKALLEAVLSGNFKNINLENVKYRPEYNKAFLTEVMQDVAEETKSLQKRQQELKNHSKDLDNDVIEAMEIIQNAENELNGCYEFDENGAIKRDDSNNPIREKGAMESLNNAEEAYNAEVMAMMENPNIQISTQCLTAFNSLNRTTFTVEEFERNKTNPDFIKDYMMPFADIVEDADLPDYVLEPKSKVEKALEQIEKVKQTEPFQRKTEIEKEIDRIGVKLKQNGKLIEKCEKEIANLDKKDADIVRLSEIIHTKIQNEINMNPDLPYERKIYIVKEAMTEHGYEYEDEVTISSVEELLDKANEKEYEKGTMRENDRTEAGLESETITY